MAEPDRVTFSARGSLILEGIPGPRIINYWFHDPFFWRAEQDGALILQVGHADHVKYLDQMVFDIRLLSKPRILAHDLGFRGDEEASSEVHSPTGRLGYRTTLPDDSRTSMLVDAETNFVLQLQGIYAGVGVNGNHDRFEVVEALAPALFAETSLDSQGYYHGSLG